MNRHYHDHKHNISNYSSLSLPLLPIMIILKLAGVIDLSWFWIIAIPILVPLGIFAAVLICCGLFLAGIFLYEYISKK